MINLLKKWFEHLKPNVLEKSLKEVDALSWTMGHRIISYRGSEEWFYADTGESTAESRACIKCNNFATKEGHDPCIVNLPGVQFACCGHGITEGYIHFWDGETKRFEANQENIMVKYAENKMIKKSSIES